MLVDSLYVGKEYFVLLVVEFVENFFLSLAAQLTTKTYSTSILATTSFLRFRVLIVPDTKPR